jgi:hypothetical protein
MGNSHRASLGKNAVEKRNIISALHNKREYKDNKDKTNK